MPERDAMNQASIPLLPPTAELESWQVLKKLSVARGHLGELKGLSKSIPNERILINTLALQEAKASSEIENIITTHDELYRVNLLPDRYNNAAAKEVSRYVMALNKAFSLIRKDKLLTLNNIIEVHGVLEENDAGFRKLPGTVIKNEQTGETVHTPPQNHAEIVTLMNNLEQFMNDPDMCDADPLIKMAVIHHQFETIHPFYDGNGRTGRIINIIYLVTQGLLDLPVLYLSRHITRNKSEYYQLLQSTHETADWEAWILYMLDGVIETSLRTLMTVNNIKEAMSHFKHRVRSALPRIYSQDLVNSLFRHPYKTIATMQRDLSVSRLTASRYLNLLLEEELLEKFKSGRHSIYVNRALFDLLLDAPNA